MKTICSIVIPIYNEAKSLEILLKRIETIKENGFEFLIVDNGSVDERVPDILRNQNKEGWNYIRTEVNKGFGGGIAYGISHCETEFVGWMPGNLKVDPKEVVDVLSRMNWQNVDMVKATRTNRSLSAKFKTGLVGILQSVLLLCNMLDAGGTPTVCRKTFFVGLKDVPTDYVFESYLLYRARRAKIRVVRPRVAYGIRQFGSSHWQRGLFSELRLTFKIIRASLTWRQIHLVEKGKKGKSVN